MSRKFFGMLLLGVLSVGLAGFTAPAQGDHGTPCGGCSSCDGCGAPVDSCCGSGPVCCGDADYDDDCDD